MSLYFKKFCIVLIMALPLLFVLFSFRSRGLIRVTLYNDLDSDIKLLAIQNDDVQESVKTQQSKTVSYRVSRGEISLSISLMIKGRTVIKEIIEYLEPAYHGRVTVRVFRDEAGNLDFEIHSFVSLRDLPDKQRPNAFA